MEIARGETLAVRVDCVARSVTGVWLRILYELASRNELVTFPTCMYTSLVMYVRTMFGKQV
jgi:hypothetical protein